MKTWWLKACLILVLSEFCQDVYSLQGIKTLEVRGNSVLYAEIEMVIQHKLSFYTILGLPSRILFRSVGDDYRG